MPIAKTEDAGNRADIILVGPQLFYQRRPWTKNEISEVTHLSLAGTTNVLLYLVSEGEIVQSGKADSYGGAEIEGIFACG